MPSVGTEEKDNKDNNKDDPDDDLDGKDSKDSKDEDEDEDKSMAKSMTKGMDEGADKSVFTSVIENGTMTKSATGSMTQSTQSGDEANCENKHNILLAVISRGLKGEWVTSDAAVSQHVLMPNDVVSSARSSSKRSRDMAERNGIFCYATDCKVLVLVFFSYCPWSTCYCCCITFHMSLVPYSCVGHAHCCLLQSCCS